MLKNRLLTAVILAPLGILVLLKIPQEYIWWVLAVIFGIGGYEWAQFSNFKQLWIRILIGLLTATCILTIYRTIPIQQVTYVSIAACVTWLLISLWLTKPDFASPLTPGNRLLKLMVGFFVIVSCCLALGYIFTLPHGRGWFFCVLAMIWAADIGAYFSGKAFGKHKLAPNISPGKTWEGVFGGLIAAALVSAASTFITDLNGPLAWQMALLALVVTSISIVGDLFASLLKRQVDLKDTGQLLPGHGGIIDRFDSLLAAAPFYFIGLQLLSLW